MAAFVASVFGGQPLLIPGVTGPITVFNKTIHEIFKGREDFQLLPFMGWVYLWGAILHWVTASLNCRRGVETDSPQSSSSSSTLPASRATRSDSTSHQSTSSMVSKL